MTKEELEKEAEQYINSKQKPLTKYDLIAFAEPREKRIADLEKDKQYFSDSLDKQIEATLKLQQENEELKGLKDVATLIRANNDTVTTLMQLNNMLVSKNQKLTKAKNILSNFLNACEDYEISEARAEAEQFLKEIEK